MSDVRGTDIDAQNTVMGKAAVQAIEQMKLRQWAVNKAVEVVVARQASKEEAVWEEPIYKEGELPAFTMPVLDLTKALSEFFYEFTTRPAFALVSEPEPKD